MARLFYGHVQSGDVVIHYYRTADEKPPVILLHGLTDNGLCWGNLAMALESEFDVIMIDARGHGLSGTPPDGYSPEEQAGDVATVIRELGLDRPPVVGHSMGALVGAELAAKYPDLVGCLVLEDPSWTASPYSSEDAAKQVEAWRQVVMTYRGKSLDELMAIGKEMHPSWKENELFQWAKAKQQVHLETVTMLQRERKPWQETARKIACPVLLITGDPQLGSIVTAEVAAEAKRCIQNSQVVHIPGAGHNIHREQYMPYYRAMYSFISGQPKKKKKL